MSRWPEMTRLCALLADRDEVAPTAVLALADQLDAAATARPSPVRRVHAVFGHAAADWAADPSEATESRLVVVHRAAMAITSAAQVVSEVDDD